MTSPTPTRRRTPPPRAAIVKAHADLLDSLGITTEGAGEICWACRWTGADWVPERAHLRAHSLIPLWSAALGEAPTSIDGEADPDTELGTVMLAALAREAISEGRGVSARWLGALGSCSPTHARTEVTIADGEVAADEARRWLSGRGVPGFGKAQ